MSARERTEPIANLCFHGIGTPTRALEPDEDLYWVSHDLYRRVLDLVADRVDIAISFDDGNESDFTLGLPGLLERDLTGSFFVLGGRIDQPGSTSTAQVRELVTQGMVVGSHGMDHRSWRALNPIDAERELDDARVVIAEASRAVVDAVACPFGIYGRRTLSQLRQRDYRRVMTSDRAFASADGWIQPRFSIRADDTVDSVAALVERRSRARRVADRARLAVKSRR